MGINDKLRHISIRCYLNFLFTYIHVNVDLYTYKYVHIELYVYHDVCKNIMMYVNCIVITVIVISLSQSTYGKICVKSSILTFSSFFPSTHHK